MNKRDVLDLISVERLLQDQKWGEQNHPDGTGPAFRDQADAHRRSCDRVYMAGESTWRHIFLEEVYEALAESDPARLVQELIQVAAVAVAWVEAIERRGWRAAPARQDADKGAK